MANALNRTEATRPTAFTAAAVRRDALGRRRAFSAFVAERDRRVVGYRRLGAHITHTRSVVLLAGPLARLAARP